MSWLPKSKKVQRRLVMVGFIAITLGAASVLALGALKSGVVYFYTPEQMITAKAPTGRLTRLGGLVKVGSVKHLDSGKVAFDVTDNRADMHVLYQGDLPDLFREGQGVVCEGKRIDPSHFEAATVLAKHDEKYMPREVVKALKAQGQWRR